MGSNKYQQAPDPETVRENARAAAERRLQDQNLQEQNLLGRLQEQNLLGRLQEQNLLDVPGNKPKLLRCPMSPRPARNHIELSDARAWN